MYEGWPGYLTWDEEVKLAQYGWELGSHTYIHKPLPLLSRQERKADLKKSHDHMLGLYYSPNGVTLSYPNGAYNKEVVEDVKEAGYAAGVTGSLGPIRNRMDCLPCAGQCLSSQGEKSGAFQKGPL